MNYEPAPVVAENVSGQSTWYSFPRLCWAAIIGGVVAAMGIQILLTTLGIGAGLAAFSPMSDYDPGKHFSEATAAIWTVCAWVSLFFGAVIAGRYSASLHAGLVHGVLVWSLSLIVTLLLLSAGTGMLLGGAMKVLGAGLGMGGHALTAGVGDLAKNGVHRSHDQLSSFIDEADQSIATNGAPGAAIRAKREIGFALTKLFTPGNDAGSPTNRQDAIKALTNYAHMSQVEATKTVNDWTTSANELKAELASLKATADQKARQAAKQAAEELSIAGIWAFFGVLIGLLVSAAGGILGADCALRKVKMNRVQSTQMPVS